MFILPLFNKTALKAVVSLHILLCDHKMFASKTQTEHVVRMDLLYSSFFFLRKKQRDRPLISIRRWGFTLQKRLDRGASWKYSEEPSFVRLTGRRLLREAISLSDQSILLCLFSFHQDRLERGEDEGNDKPNTPARHLNTKASVCVRCWNAWPNSLACSHHGAKRQMAQTW